MASGAVRTNSRRVVGLVAALLSLSLAGCVIRRSYIGPEIRIQPKEVLVVGVTTKQDVLHLCGPPDELQGQYDGDVFVYEYSRENFALFTIREPLVLRLNLFTYSRLQDKRDRLVILFDPDGVVKSYALKRDTPNLKTF